MIISGAKEQRILIAFPSFFVNGLSITNRITQFRSFSFWWKKDPPLPPLNYSIVEPELVKLKPDISIVPSNIVKPVYAIGNKEQIPSQPVIWNSDEIEKIKCSCKLARKCLEFASSLVKPGITTKFIDDETREFIFKHGAYPSPLGFKNFPRSISTSVNNVAAHGIPDKRPLEEGDIVNIDVTVYLNGFHGDCSDTFPVGKIDDEAAKLIQITKQCLDIGIAACKNGAYYLNIGKEIDRHCKLNKVASIQYLLGHGIGTFFHGPPDIYHCLNSYPGKMKTGMVFTVEPCIIEGVRKIKYARDGWTLLSDDNSRTAQSEHTILITEHGAEILTIL